MHLGQHRHPPALDTLDEPQLPQRSAAIERVGDQPPDQPLEFCASARRGNGDLPHVIVEVKLAVLDRPRPVDAQRGTGHPPAQHRQLGDASSEKVGDRVEAEIRRLRRVTDRQSADVLGVLVCLDEQKHGIVTGQMLHSDRLVPVAPTDPKSAPGLPGSRTPT